MESLRNSTRPDDDRATRTHRPAQLLQHVNSSVLRYESTILRNALFMLKDLLRTLPERAKVHQNSKSNGAMLCIVIFVRMLFAVSCPLLTTKALSFTLVVFISKLPATARHPCSGRNAATPHGSDNASVMRMIIHQRGATRAHCMVVYVACYGPMAKNTPTCSPPVLIK